MPNMSYCRFRNTNLDMQDCIETVRGLADLCENIEWLETSDFAGRDEELEESLEELKRHSLSEEESRAAYRLFDSVLELMWELEIIEDYPKSKLNELIAKISK